MLHHAMYVYPKSTSNKQYIHDNSRKRERTQDADHTPTDDNNEIQKGIEKSRKEHRKPSIIYHNAAKNQIKIDENEKS